MIYKWSVVFHVLVLCNLLIQNFIMSTAYGSRHDYSTDRLSRGLAHTADDWRKGVPKLFSLAHNVYFF